MLGLHRWWIVGVAMFIGALTGVEALAAERQAARPATKDADPDENSEPVSAFEAAEIERILQAAVGSNCQAVGGNTTAANGQFRYRGNVLHIEATDAKLTEFKMALRFSGTTTLSFSIHKRDITQEPEVWQRVFLRNVNAIGSGAYQMYSSGPISLNPTYLEPNTDYAFGVAWGGTTVFFVRNGVTQPKDLAARVGQSLGLISYNGVTPPVDEQLPPPTIATVGAYQMEFCFESVNGACCSSGLNPPGCVAAKETECTQAGSYFHGERVGCSEVNCFFGACCLSCANGCADHYTPEACTAAHGTHHRGDGVACPPAGSPERSELCPTTTGACCTGAHCDVKCYDECLSIGGTYAGDDTGCAPNVCVGACCISGTGCSEVTQAACTLFGGGFRGNGTECARLHGADDPQDPNDPGECGGACCYSGPASGCVQKTTRLACTESPAGIPNAVYRGDATTCSDCPGIATVAACCLPDGTCINTTPSFCVDQARGVASAIGTQCSELSPPACPIKGCCFEDGHCEFLTEPGCTAFGGVSTLSCSALACDAALTATKRACCLGGVGECEVRTRANCEADGGVFKPDDTSCSAGICPGFGACCTPDNACVDQTSRSRCTLLQGTFNEPEGSTCFDLGVDCDRRTACCLPNGGCAFLDPDDCTAIGGAPDPEEGTPCERVGLCPSGACCFGDGTCGIRAPHACQSGQGRIYQGDRTTCAAGLCSLGACCTGETCQDHQVQSQCSGVGTNFGAGLTCQAGTCVAAACCLPTFGGTCQELTGLECAEADGSYQSGSFCPVGEVADPPCVLGACCALDGTCQANVFAVQCAAPNQFHEGVACGVTPCIPRGACCVPGNQQCQIMTFSACTAADGVYAGNGVACSAGLCTVGACCQADIGCQTVSALQCNAASGNFQGSGTVCKSVECPLSCHDVVVETSPANCTIDAGYPHTAQATPARLRWKTLSIKFECDARALSPADFSLREVPVSGTPTGIASVEPVEGDLGSVRLTFDQFINVGRWTCVTHGISGEEICIGLLPADADGDGKSDEFDVSALVNHLDAVEPLSVHRCDVDRSNACYSNDLIELIDLINGTDPGFVPLTTLPACPTAP